MRNSLLRRVVRPLLAQTLRFVCCLFKIFPLQNKVAVMANTGKSYDENPKYIVEEIHRLLPDIDIVWMKDRKYCFQVPSWMRCVDMYGLKWLYEMMTARVWICNTIMDYLSKREGQIYVETWHGGLGIKRIGIDCGIMPHGLLDSFLTYKHWDVRDADVMLANSGFLANIYRNTFGYKGPIWNSGYPKNDILVNSGREIYLDVRDQLGINKDTHILLYAPTWRKYALSDNEYITKVYNIDFNQLKKTLEAKFGGKWLLMVRFHQNIRNIMKKYESKSVMDVSGFPDIQRLILASDAMISDFSSCIFDAAFIGKPCFTYVADFEDYIKNDYGVYFEMDSLPFPYSQNNKELTDNILNFNEKEYRRKWASFSKQVKHAETGHSANDVAERLVMVLKGEKVIWPNDFL